MSATLMPYTKLDHQILASSIWEVDDSTFKIWIGILTLTDKYGVVKGSIGGLARLLGKPVKECERALKILSAPDPKDTSGVKEGRRIEAVAGGWLVINHQKFRDRRDDPDDRAAYMREWRARQKVKSRELQVTTSNNSRTSDQIKSDQINTLRGKESQRNVTRAKAGELELTKASPPDPEVEEFERLKRYPDLKTFELYCSEYARSIGKAARDWQPLFDYFEGPGWRMKGEPIVKWKATTRRAIREDWQSENALSGESLMTRERIFAWCKKKRFSDLAPIVAGKILKGRYYGELVTSEERFNDIMARELDDYKKHD